MRFGGGEQVVKVQLFGSTDCGKEAWLVLQQWLVDQRVQVGLLKVESKRGWAQVLLLLRREKFRINVLGLPPEGKSLLLRIAPNGHRLCFLLRPLELYGDFVWP